MPRLDFLHMAVWTSLVFYSDLWLLRFRVGLQIGCFFFGLAVFVFPCFRARVGRGDGGGDNVHANAACI